MGCLVTLLALITPRIVMVGIWLTTDWFGRAYETTLWPVLGFIFMPYTSLAYMAAILNNGRVSGLWILLLIVAIIADLSSDGEASRRRARKQRAGKAEPAGT
ncbi:MAG: hypothetical protein ACYS47_17800 [Planctomycetota bacterium]|jgi:hypothetical protein